MESLRKQKSYTDVRNRGAQAWNRKVYIDSEGFHHISTAAMARGRPIPMFRDANACTSHNKRSCGGNIKGSRAVAARTTGVEHGQNLTVPKWLRLFAHNAGETYKLLWSLTLHPQRCEERGNLSFAREPRENFLHSLSRFGR